MAKAILICGRLCSGKSTYAHALRRSRRGAVLSIDELLLPLFGQNPGERYDACVEIARRILFQKSLELIESGVDAILDWGFWTKGLREEARSFYAARGVPCEFHYLDVPDAEWKRRLRERNAAVKAGGCSAYFVDANLYRKFEGLFEAPSREEIDVWVDGGALPPRSPAAGKSR